MALLPPIFTVWRSSGGAVRLRHSRPDPRPVASVRERDVSDPTPQYSRRGGRLGEVYVSSAFPAGPVPWPSSGSDAPATLPQMFRAAVVRGEDASPVLLPSPVDPRRVAFVWEGDASSDPPPDIAS